MKLSFGFFALSCIAVENDSRAPLWCARYILEGSPSRGFMTPFLASCLTKTTRIASFPLVFSAYLLYLTGKFEGCVDFTLSAYLVRGEMLKFLYNLKISTNTSRNNTKIPESKKVVEPLHDLSHTPITTNTTAGAAKVSATYVTVSLKAIPRI